MSVASTSRKIVSRRGTVQADLCVHMPVAIAPLCERFVAVFTSIRSLTCMCSHMVKYVAKFTELLVARETLKYLILPACLRIDDFGTLVAFLL